MNGDLMQALQRRLMNGDSEAQDLAWKLHRANDLDTMLLLDVGRRKVQRILPHHKARHTAAHTAASACHGHVCGVVAK